MTSPRLLLAAGTVAATVAGLGPAVTNGAPVAPLRVGAEGVAISLGQVRAAAPAELPVVVPQGVTRLSGSTTGSPALAARTHLTVVRSSDGATLFTGSPATFGSLPVTAGTQLRIHIAIPAGFRALKAAAMLRWS